jgi:hypothetical protein
MYKASKWSEYLLLVKLTSYSKVLTGQEEAKMAIRNRKERRAAYAKASSQKKLKTNHPMNRIAKLVQKLKSRIKNEGNTNEQVEENKVS